MNYLFGCATGVALAVPATIWVLQRVPDPEAEATKCYKTLMAQMAREQLPIPKTGDADKMVIRMSPPTMALAGRCKERLQEWAKRDGEKLVNQKLARVALIAFAENSTDPIARMLVMQKVREMDAAIARGEWAN